MKIGTVTFSNGAAIPKQYTGDGRDISPSLIWESIPTGTKELAIIVDDPDAPTPDPWVHWLIYRIPVRENGVPEGVSLSQQIEKTRIGLEGKNSWNTVGYRGPAPPQGHGLHRYQFKLYALDATLALDAGVDKQTLLQAMQGHILAEAKTVGTYER